MPVIPEDIEAYALAHTTPPSTAMQQIVDDTKAMGRISGMMTGPLEGRFLEFLVYALQAETVLEIGTFTGYGATSMASALPPGGRGRVITCDVNPDAHATARKHAEAAGVADRIDFRLGPALDTIATLDGPFDLVFIDADKTNYSNYYEAVLPKLAPTGMIGIDNTLWSGQVVDESDRSDNTVAIRAVNDLVRDDPRVVCVQLSVRDGVTLIRRA